MNKNNLKIDWATHQAAKFSCEKWHYSGCLPAGKLVKIGVWEKGQFIGVVLYGRGASPFLGKKYNLNQDEICELVRVALTNHENSVSRIMAISFKFLKKNCPKLKMIVSFADQNEGHHGGIYQATNWIYSGLTGETTEVYLNGKWVHMRGAFYKMKKNTPTRIAKGKHRYLMPLTKAIETLVKPLSKPYPKRIK